MDLDHTTTTTTTFPDKTKGADFDSPTTVNGTKNEEEDEDDDRSRGPDHPVTRTEPRSSYCPTEAWEDVPGQVFSWKPEPAEKASVRAKAFARQRRRAIYALEVTDGSRTMNYVVGGWETAVDMVVRRQLFGPRGPTRLMMQNTDALGAVYECVFDDQRVQPYFDLEFYSDAGHGNAHRDSSLQMDRMTRCVAYIASSLISELFPDQVNLVIDPDASATLLQHAAPPSTSRDWPSRELVDKHYKPPQGLAVEPARLDAEKHWHVLDASRESKRSHHLILDASAGMCWDTQIDQAIFVGMLYRRIYRAALGDDKTESDPFRDMARSLFIQEDSTVVGEKGKRIPVHNWTLLIDPVVYKRFQLIRTAFSSKRTQNRPFNYRNDVFDDTCLWCPSDRSPSRSEILRATLIGRVGQGSGTVHRLSFAHCYPGMFPGGGAGEDTAAAVVPTSALSLAQWKWVPNYFGRGQDAPPRLIHKSGEPSARGPWRFASHVKTAQDWLRRTNPCRSLSLLDNFRDPPVWERVPSPAGVLPPLPPQQLSPGSVCNQWAPAGTAKECVAQFIAHSTMLAPWIEEAGSEKQLAQILKVEAGMYRDTKTGRTRLSALASPNLHYCPIHKGRHSGNGAMLYIDGQRGYVTVRCKSTHCTGQSCRPRIAMLPEYLDVIFPERRRRHPQPVKGPQSEPPLKKRKL